MSNTDLLRTSESAFLPPGFVQDHVFQIKVEGYHGRAEVDGYHPISKEAIEICQSESVGDSPKPGQKRKLAADVLKLIFLHDLGLISRGRVIVSSRAMYDWCQQTGSWLNAARKRYGIVVELRGHANKFMRRKIRNAMKRARRAG